MITWITLLITNMLIPVIMLIFGYYFKRKSPKEINYLFGYRTERSMKNEDTWEFAHRKIGGLWVRWGWVLLAVTVVAMLLLFGKDEDTVGWTGTGICMLQLIPLIGSIFPVEKALKETFDENGKRR